MSFIGLENNEKYLYISNNNNNDTDKEIETIISSKDNNNLNKHQPRNDILFTPDSLESSSDDDANASTSTPSSSLSCDNDLLIADEQQTPTKTNKKNVIEEEDYSIEGTKIPVLVPSEEMLSVEETKKFQPISIKNEDILEKIRKINKLQDKINDINVKIKLSNQQNGAVKTNNKVNNYYCIANNVDDILDNFISNEASSSESNDLIDNEKFFDYADHDEFEATINKNNNNSIEDETLDYYFEDDTKFNEDSQNYFNMNDENSDYENHDEDGDDDDDILNGNFKFCLKQAQPVHKKFASTGLLFYKIKYLDTIVEVEEATVSVDDNNSDTQEKIAAAAGGGGNKFRKCSTSCFNLTTKSSFDDDINSCSSEILIDDNECGVSENDDDDDDDDVFNFNFNINKGTHHTFPHFYHMKLI